MKEGGDNERNPPKIMRTKRHCRNPPPPSDQTLRRIGEDRISALPDALLILILSYLPVIDAVKTGVLSKRWSRLWTWTPNLVFDQLGEWDEKSNNFVPFIDAFLVLHSSPKIQKLAIDMDYRKRLHLDNSMDEWLRFASGRAAEELNLQLSELGYFHSWDFRANVERYLLPSFIYSNNSMKRLDMSFIDVQPSDAISWPLLQSLSIRSAFITESTIQKFLLGSPHLKILELSNCEGFDLLRIDSKSLKRLVIHGIWHPSGGTDDVLQISAPKILSLEISGHFYKRRVQLLDVSSLVDVVINLQVWVEDRRCVLVEYSNILREILRKIRHVEKLNVGACSIKVYI